METATPVNPMHGDDYATLPSAPPMAEEMDRGAPWDVPAHVVYGRFVDPHPVIHVPAELARASEALPGGRNDAAWKKHREQLLREWGRRRERSLHRWPSCLMDQLQSGSGLFPVRLLDESEWLSEEEVRMVDDLERRVLAGTGGGRALALDMLTPVVYNINTKIILDNSGSMGLGMFGPMQSSAITLKDPCGVPHYFTDKDAALRQLFQWEANICCGRCPNPCGGCCGPAGFCAPNAHTQTYAGLGANL